MSEGAAPRKRYSRWRTVLFPLIAGPLAFALRTYWRTTRMRVSGDGPLEALLAEGKPVIPCCWHQRQLFAIAYLLRLRPKGLRFAALVSPSKDGELGATLLTRLGAVAVRGSGRRSGAVALRDMFLAVKEQNLSPLIAPDGSIGPPSEFKPGAIMLARLTGCPVVPLSFACSRGIRLPTWDRFLVPLPFSRVEIAVGAPIHLGPAVAMSEDPALIVEMGRRLDEVEQAAESRLRGASAPAGDAR